MKTFDVVDPWIMENGYDWHDLSLAFQFLGDRVYERKDMKEEFDKRYSKKEVRRKVNELKTIN